MSIELIPEEDIWHLELVPEEDVKRKNDRTKNNNIEYSIFRKRFGNNKDNVKRKDNGTKNSKMLSNDKKNGYNIYHPIERSIEYSIYSKYVEYLIFTERKKKGIILLRRKIQNSKFRKNIFSIKDWAWAVCGENSEDVLREMYDEDSIKKVKMIDILRLLDDGYLYEKGRFVIQRNYGNVDSDSNGDGNELQQDNSLSSSSKMKKTYHYVHVDKCEICTHKTYYGDGKEDKNNIKGSFWREVEYFFVIKGIQFSCHPNKEICQYRKVYRKMVKKELRKEISDWYSMYFK